MTAARVRDVDAPEAAERQVHRPGISPDFLAAAGVRHVDATEAERLVGYAASGLVIPYRQIDGSPILTPDGRPFHRLRLDKPTGSAKYLSPKASGAQLYVPPRLRRLLPPGCDLYVIEGEFKALSLSEAGFAAVGVGGISSACRRDGDRQVELLPDLAALVEQVRPARILFCGDSDTSLIPAFAHEAVKLAQAAGVPVALPRIPIDSPGKAPDDLRELLGDGFPEHWRTIVDAAETVTPSTKPAALAVRLLRREEKALATLAGDARDNASRRIVRMACDLHSDPIEFEAVAAIAVKFLSLGRAALQRAIKAERDRKEAEADRRRWEEIVRRLAERPEPVLLFDGTSYFRREADGEFGKLCREDARLHLGMLGLSQRGEEGAPSEADAELHRIQQEHRVHYAGPICGRPAGIHREGTLTLLATRGPRWIEGKPGSWTTIETLLANLFGASAGDPHAGTQLATFCAWLKLGRIAVREYQTHRPGQVLGMVGPKDCGKSLVQAVTITPAFGGRVADPTLWFTGKSAFNYELWGAEHLGFGDKSLGEDGRERAHLRDELKRAVGSTEYPCHKKYGDAVTMRPVWRISFSANDDPESAISLPALDASFADKMIYLRCYAPPAPFFDAASATGREDFVRRIAAELPAFLYDIDRAEIPPAMASARFGVREFHHPYIVDLIETGSALVPLAEIVEEWIDGWAPGTDENARTATEMFRDLEADLRGISPSPAVLGRQLARLAETQTWKDRLARAERRVGNRQKQTVWRFRRAA